MGGRLAITRWSLLGCPPPEGSPRRLALDVQGVHCAACVWLLQELFGRLPGAIELRINPSVGKADLVWREPADLVAFLEEAARFGYRFGPSRKRAPRRSHGLLIRLGVCTAAAAGFAFPNGEIIGVDVAI